MQNTRAVSTPSTSNTPESSRALPANTKAWLQIHACVVLWGFTAILGKLISLPALPLVFWRMTLVSTALLITPRFWSGVRKIARRSLAIYAGIGVVVALHWLCFYGAIKLSNASIAVVCLALCPMFIALLEPLLTRRRIERLELLLGVLVVPSVALVVGATPSELRWGIALGALSALLAAIFSALNKRYVTHGDALAVTGIEMLAGALFLAPWAARESGLIVPGPRDLGLLLVLSLFCTLLPFALSLVALRRLSAFASALAINLEPVYTILLASLFFGEQRELSLGFYAGACTLVLLCGLHPVLTAGTAARRA